MSENSFAEEVLLLKIALFGLGLIGGSLGRAVIKNTDYSVYGKDVDSEAVLKARMLNAITDELTDELLGKCDLIVLSVNPRIAIKLLEEICPKLKKGATVTDCCGNKRGIVNKMEELHEKYPDIGFIGAHPMAGREFSGIQHSTAKLFEHSYVILTPVHSGIKDFEKVKGFFVAAGCEGTVLASAEEHDEMISYTSQLAHVVSSAYVKNPLSVKHAGYSAGSFRDLTRVAKLNPDMWTELFIDNSDELAPRIGEIIENLKEYKTAIENKDAVTLRKLLESGVEAKAAAENAMREKRREDK